MHDRYGARELLTAAQAAEAMPKWQLVLGRMHLVVRFADAEGNEAGIRTWQSEPETPAMPATSEAPG